MSRTYRVFVGNLPETVEKADLEKTFGRFRPEIVDLKRPPRGPFFAFLEFTSSRDAEGTHPDGNGRATVCMRSEGDQGGHCAPVRW